MVTISLSTEEALRSARVHGRPAELTEPQVRCISELPDDFEVVGIRGGVPSSAVPAASSCGSPRAGG